MDTPRSHSLLALLTLLGGMAVASAFVALKCWRDPAIPFLSARPPAQWVVYPLDWQLTARQVKERRVRFRRAFTLTNEPAEGTVELRAFRGYMLWVNGKRIGGVEDLAAAWKRPQRHDVTAALRAGENLIEVEVVHITGPPALWLAFRAGETTAATNATWTASLNGGPFESVRLATAPMEHPITETSPTIAEGWRATWEVVLASAAVAVLLTIMGFFWGRRAAPVPESTSDSRVELQPVGLAEKVALGVAVLLWVALCANNLYRLPPVTGFDSPAHFEYVDYLLRNRTLPLADDGWEMYQPPLYYVLGALGVAAGQAVGWEDAPTSAPKLISMLAGIAQVVLVWLVVCVMFPTSRRARLAGLVLAAAMPMALYISQYPSNEMLSVALVTAAVWLALRAIRDHTTSWRRYAVLGVVLGLGMLAKHTAFVALVAIFAVLATRLLFVSERRLRLAGSSLGVTALAVLLVAGWFAGRNLYHFGNPLIGNWDPESGNAWWQDPGVGTAAYYLRFGRCLTEPFHSCLYSYGDAIYSTMWGDGMCAGIADVRFRPPWHYRLMAVGFVISWWPTLLIVVGGVLAVVRWIRRPDAAWAILLLHAALVAFAVFYMTLKLPYYAQAKGFYGLTVMACLCVLGAWGFDRLAGRLGRAGIVLWVPLLTWALVSYASYFVWPMDAKTHFHLGEVFPFQGKPERGVQHLRRAVELDPSRIMAHVRLGEVLSNLGRYADAGRAWERGLDQEPNHVLLLTRLAWLRATCADEEVRDGASAVELASRACAITDNEDLSALDALAAAHAEVGEFEQAVETLERAIRRARKQGNSQALERLRSRLALYEARQPYRMPTK